MVRKILDGLPRGRALDAACGTARHAEYLVSLGYSVIGVDSTPQMLAVAKAKLPDAEFREGDLHRAPAGFRGPRLCGTSPPLPGDRPERHAAQRPARSSFRHLVAVALVPGRGQRRLPR